jgi:hypothetical protein
MDNNNDQICDYSDSIQNYEHVLSELIRCAETENQRESLGLLIQLFKNKFKIEYSLIQSVWRLEAAIYNWRNVC